MQTVTRGYSRQSLCQSKTVGNGRTKGWACRDDNNTRFNKWYSRSAYWVTYKSPWHMTFLSLKPPISPETVCSHVNITADLFSSGANVSSAERLSWESHNFQHRFHCISRITWWVEEVHAFNSAICLNGSLKSRWCYKNAEPIIPPWHVHGVQYERKPNSSLKE